MSIRPLTKAQIRDASLRKKNYIIHDKNLKGFHLRMTSTDGRRLG